MEHVLIETSAVLSFLRERGYRTSGSGLSTFFGQEGTSEVDVDVESELIDLTHLVQDWTTVGAQHLADELLVELGFRNY